ncbi:hypothetical protein CYMTET_22226 [Cymbomonas tetramitiformis]|uniref:Uncharacterized protein n=1 Tax=Cymbomonas tetramitiformis TaxID=36881 RepID=A0AAE0L2E6_9CHLO|nr:hypothetical protein CYMTET_22226 [Cymbomonas tetramitiformis]
MGGTGPPLECQSVLWDEVRLTAAGPPLECQSVLWDEGEAGLRLALLLSASVSCGMRVRLTAAGVCCVNCFVELGSYYDIQRQLRIFRYLAWPGSSLREARLLSAFLAEVFLCGLHIPPGSELALGWLSRHVGSLELPSDSFKYMVFFAFCRVYTFPRILLYRGAFISTKIRFLGSLNNVEFDVIFVLRSFLRLFPVRTISFGLLTTILTSGYSLQLCEADHASEEEDHLYILSWMYYVCGNMLGFDPRIYPSTYCGRFIAVFSSIWSTLILSTLIAVIAQGLELNFAESKVVDNMKYDQVTSELHHSAVQAMQRAWRSYKRHGIPSRSCWPLMRVKPKELASIRSKLTKGRWYSTDLMQALHRLKKVRRKFKAVKEADIMCTVLEEVYQVKHLNKEIEAKIRSIESKQRTQLSSLGSTNYNNRRNGIMVHQAGPGEAPWTPTSPEKEKGKSLNSVSANYRQSLDGVGKTRSTGRSGRERAHTLQGDPMAAATHQLSIRTGSIRESQAEAGSAFGTSASGSQLEALKRSMQRLEEKLDKVAQELAESRQPTSAQTAPKSPAANVPNEYIEALKRLEEKMCFSPSSLAIGIITPAFTRR